jgi:hypothetical protein
MAFPSATVGSSVELPVGVFDAPAVASGTALADAGEDDPDAVGATAGAAFDVPDVASGSTLAGAGEAAPEAAGVAAASAEVPPRLAK